MGRGTRRRSGSPAPGDRAGRGDSFAALGLAARADLTDDDVRAAWRRIAAATHPDRDDGGSPERFAAAAAAYATLRTSFGRGEALAEAAEASGTAGMAATARGWLLDLAAFPGIGVRRPLASPASARLAVRLGARLFVAAAIVVLAFAAAGWSPGTVAVLVGALTWLATAFWRDRHANSG